MKTIKIIKQFLSGPLQGLEIEEEYIVEINRWFPGQVIDRPIGGSPYKILSVKEI